jgi:hypothetical protein
MSTQPTGRRLAATPNFRDRVMVRGAPITKEIAARRRRVAFCELFHDAPRKPQFIYEQQRANPRVPLPDERQHQLIHDGIRAGLITRERIIRYRATQLLDDLASFPSDTPANERLLAVLMREIGEGAQWAVVAEGTPSAENRLRASQELKEAAALCLVHAVTVERGPVQ